MGEPFSTSGNDAAEFQRVTAADSEMVRIGISGRSGSSELA
jgi:hypothetical protein